MSGYRAGSKWSDLNELRCVLAFKQLEEAGFPRNMLSDLAEGIDNLSGLDAGSVKAKIGNYKSVAGVAGHSNTSKNILSMYKKHRHSTSAQLQALLPSDQYS